MLAFKGIFIYILFKSLNGESRLHALRDESRLAVIKDLFYLYPAGFGGIVVVRVF